MSDITYLTKIAAQVRRDVIRMTSAAASGHPGGSLSSADFLTALFFDAMNIEPAKFTMDGKGEDVFYLSIGHISPAFYSVLARRGYFDKTELATFRHYGSRLQGHPTPAKHLQGVRIASGSLGQGLSNAIGHALAKKLDKDNNLVYTLHGDGELQEGQIWEAAMFAASHGVDNLIATVDWNKQQIDGCCDEVIAMGNLVAKWKAFGWEVLECPDGNNLELVAGYLKKARMSTGKGKPVMILMHTKMGKGVDFMCGTNEWHGKAPNKELAEKALAQLPETLGDY